MRKRLFLFVSLKEVTYFSLKEMYPDTANYKYPALEIF